MRQCLRAVPKAVPSAKRSRRAVEGFEIVFHVLQQVESHSFQGKAVHFTSLWLVEHFRHETAMKTEQTGQGVGTSGVAQSPRQRRAFGTFPDVKLSATLGLCALEYWVHACKVALSLDAKKYLYRRPVDSLRWRLHAHGRRSFRRGHRLRFRHNRNVLKRVLPVEEMLENTMVDGEGRAIKGGEEPGRRKTPLSNPIWGAIRAIWGRFRRPRQQIAD